MLTENITQKQFDDLPEVLQGEYKKNSDGTYDLQHDGVSTLKKSLDKKDDALKEKDLQLQQLRDTVEKFRDLDPERAREALEELDELKRKELIEKGDVDALVTQATAKVAKERDSFKEKFENERSFTEGLLIDSTLRRVLGEGGKDADGNPLPRVKPQLLKGAMSMLRDQHKPRIVEDKADRKAFAKVNGTDMELGDALREWLTSDEAKDWTEAPDHEGGFEPSTPPKDGGSGRVRTLTGDPDASAFEDIASGKAVRAE